MSGRDQLGTFSCSGLSGTWFRFPNVDYSVTAGGGTCSLNGTPSPGTQNSYNETGEYVEAGRSADGLTGDTLVGAVVIDNY